MGDSSLESQVELTEVRKSPSRAESTVPLFLLI